MRQLVVGRRDAPLLRRSKEELALDNDPRAARLHRSRVTLINLNVEPRPVERRPSPQAADGAARNRDPKGHVRSKHDRPRGGEGFP
jgi:hypothetical protein